MSGVRGRTTYREVVREMRDYTGGEKRHPAPPHLEIRCWSGREEVRLVLPAVYTLPHGNSLPSVFNVCVMSSNENMRLENVKAVGSKVPKFYELVAARVGVGGYDRATGEGGGQVGGRGTEIHVHGIHVGREDFVPVLRWGGDYGNRGSAHDYVYKLCTRHIPPSSPP